VANEPDRKLARAPGMLSLVAPGHTGRCRTASCRLAASYRAGKAVGTLRNGAVGRGRPPPDGRGHEQAPHSEPGQPLAVPAPTGGSRPWAASNALSADVSSGRARR
jgi:hypothetical protein